MVRMATTTKYYDDDVERKYRDLYHHEYLDLVYEVCPFGPVRYIGFPGKRWPAERMLITRCALEERPLYMISVERHKKVWLEIINRRPVERDDDRYVSQTLFPMPSFQWKYGRIIHGNMSELLSLSREDFCTLDGYDPAALHGWSYEHWLRCAATCFQFDFTDRINKEVEWCCRNVGEYIVPNAPVPFSISFTMGRETTRLVKYLRAFADKDAKPVDVRAEALRVMLKTHTKRPVLLRKVWQYRSPDGRANIGNMMGVILPAKV